VTADTRRARMEREAWIDDVLASDLPHKFKTLAVRIARYKNDRTGQCNPSVATLAQGIGQSERTVQRWLPELRQCGWIDYTDNRGGLGKSTQFNLTKPRHKCVTLSEPGKGDNPDPKGCQTEPERVTHFCHPNLRTKENQSKEEYIFKDGRDSESNIDSPRRESQHALQQQPPKVKVLAGTEQWDAWLNYSHSHDRQLAIIMRYRQENGQGWVTTPTEWPPS
jgi:Helix-turn-helix domain